MPCMDTPLKLRLAVALDWCRCRETETDPSTKGVVACLAAQALLQLLPVFPQGRPLMTD